MTKINRLFYLFLLNLLLIPQAHAEWVDISPSVEISQTPQAVDRINRELFSYVTIKNSSSLTIAAPLQLGIIDPSIPVINADGVSDDYHSYIQLDEDILAGTEKTVRVSFELARKRLSYTARLTKEGYLRVAPSGDYYNPPSKNRYISINNTVNELFRPYVDGAFILWVADRTSTEKVRDIASSIGATIQGHFSDTHEYLLIVTKPGLSYQQMIDLKEQLSVFPEVELANINYLKQLHNTNSLTQLQNSKFEYDNQYHLKKAGIIAAWEVLLDQDKKIGGIDKIIGVIDNMLYSDHSDLNLSDLSATCTPDSIKECQEEISRNKDKFSIFNLSPSPTQDERDYSVGVKRSEEDNLPFLKDPFTKKRVNISHGTHVTGIISATHNSATDIKVGEGTSGVLKNKQVLFMRWGDRGEYDFQWVQRRMVIDYHANIINISLGNSFIESIVDPVGFDKELWCLYIHKVIEENDIKNPELEIVIEQRDTYSDTDVDKYNFLGRDCKEKLSTKKYYLDQISDADTRVIIEKKIFEVVMEFISERDGMEKFYSDLLSTNDDIMLVAAAGNENMDAYMSGNPCSIGRDKPELRSKILCVGALAEDSKRWSRSNYGPTLDIYTFGENILSTYYAFKLSEGEIVFDELLKEATSNGTSMSTPIITGIAGLVWNAYPNLTAAQVREAIIMGTESALGKSTYCATDSDDRLVINDPVYANITTPIVNAACALKYVENHFVDDININSGLVAYYQFEGDTKDSSPFGNNGDPDNINYDVEGGVLGQAVKIGDYYNPGHIRVPNSSSLQFTDKFTVSYFVRLDSQYAMDGYGRVSIGGARAVFAKDHDRTGIFNLSYLSSSTEILTSTLAKAWYSGVSFGASTKKEAYVLGEWVHVAFVIDGDEIIGYINGEENSRTTGNTIDFSTSNSRDLYLGKFSQYWYPLGGSLDEFRLYNRSLNAAEISAIYNLPDNL